MCLGRYTGPHIIEPPVQELCECGLTGLDISADLHLRNQACALALSLPLGSAKGMPLALAAAGSRISHFDNDAPMTGRALAHVSPHFEPSPSSRSKPASSRAISAISSSARSRMTIATIFSMTASSRPLRSVLAISVVVLS